MTDFWCVTAFFNPAGYRSRLENYRLFAERLARQNVNLLTVELALQDAPFCLPAHDRVLRLRGQSILWHKERLLNYAISQLPPPCRYVAWLDCDLLFDTDHWADLLVRALERYDLVQLFARVIYLPSGHRTYRGEQVGVGGGIAWQAQMYGRKWFELRQSGALPFGLGGGAWACRRDLFRPSGGLYDRMITGGGDDFLVDCCLDSFRLHCYPALLTETMKADLTDWRNRFLTGRSVSVSYLPVDVYHLWHGSLGDRAYFPRHQFLRRYDFDPRKDIALVNHVYEWSSDKPGLHQGLADYFLSRNEDAGGKS